MQYFVNSSLLFSFSDKLSDRGGLEFEKSSTINERKSFGTDFNFEETAPTFTSFRTNLHETIQVCCWCSVKKCNYIKDLNTERPNN